MYECTHEQQVGGSIKGANKHKDAAITWNNSWIYALEKLPPMQDWYHILHNNKS